MFSPLVRKGFFYTGITLLCLASGLFLAQVTGLFPVAEWTVAGESPLRSIVRVAVAGCVIAAAGCWE